MFLAAHPTTHEKAISRYLLTLNLEQFFSEQQRQKDILFFCPSIPDPSFGLCHSSFSLTSQMRDNAEHPFNEHQLGPMMHLVFFDG